MTEQEMVLMSAKAYPMPEYAYPNQPDRLITEIILDRREAYMNGIKDTIKQVPKIVHEKTEKGEMTTMIMWVARDKDGTLVLFNGEPIKEESVGRWDTYSPDGSMVIDRKSFPEITWDGEPKEVKITISLCE